jgi:hypothetical protein
LPERLPAPARLLVRAVGVCLAGSLLFSARPAGSALFRSVPATESHIEWVHQNGRSENRYLPETLSPGVAVFDYDDDGWMDLFFVNSGPSPFFHPTQPINHGLYHNNKDGTFTDVTARSGLRADWFGMGVAAGDFDGDGYVDLFVTGYDSGRLYRNTGNGTFVDVTAKAGIAAPGWSTSALWFDYNNDGRLDLFVAEFVDYSSLKVCSAEFAYGGSTESAPSPAKAFYCIPRVLDPRPSRLFRNNGDGTFTDVSGETGIATHPGKGLGVVATDINNDGFMDVFQANDTVENFLFVNRKGKVFEERALELSVAYSQDGKPRSGMGADAADIDGDGWQDLFVANIDQETFSLYHNDKGALFTDVSPTTGIGQATRLLSGWGLRFFDYDNDGRPDLILANGHPDDMVNQRMKLVQYREPLLLFHNDGNGRLANVTAAAGEPFQKSYPARGLAVGDLNNDGFLDAVVGLNGEAPLLLLNTAASRGNWLGLRLAATRSNPAAVGTIIRWSAAGVVRSRLVTGGGSFLSSHDPRIVLGIGQSRTLDWIEVKWPGPSSAVDRAEKVPANRYVTFKEGRGIITP